MRIVCIGGGPAGLYFALLMKKNYPQHKISVVERNKPYDTFGWGVVFSDATMDAMKDWDLQSAKTIQDAFNHWDDIELLFKGERIRTTGHGFVGIGRKKLLNILQQRCEELDVELVFETNVENDNQYSDADLIIACDGVNSNIRNLHEDVFQPDFQVRPNRFIWLGTNKLFDAFTFDFRETEHGWFQAHIYKFDENTSTFIVETTEEAYQAFKLGDMSQDESISFCEKLFADTLQGAKLMTNANHLRGSAWINFRHLVCNKWSYYNGKSYVVLAGDAAHTAHFAIGSGTKLAIEDAIELTKQFQIFGHDPQTIPDVLAVYEKERRIGVARIQNAARNAMEWFEVVGERYAPNFEPQQFMYSMLTRSQRISHENLRLRDKSWLENYEKWYMEKNGIAAQSGERPQPPMLTPYKIGGLNLKNRIVVSPILTYCAKDGLVNDFHLTHLGARALGGAALVISETAAVTPQGRFTPQCLGLWDDSQIAGWKRLADFIHQCNAKFGIQLGHAGRKAATYPSLDGRYRPLPEGENWPLLSASNIPFNNSFQIPKAMDKDDMDHIKQAFCDGAKRALDAGVDWLELQCGHGTLLSSFISPLTNKRDDVYGGNHENRARYPLEVLSAIRAIWPKERPISVRLSCHDWYEGGNRPEDAAIFARLFQDGGADMITCSSGEVVEGDRPLYGRMYQTPFSDLIRNSCDIATMAVGGISEADHANSILAAGRADLCAVGRPFLADPAWVLHEVAKIGIRDIEWPIAYQAGKPQYEAAIIRMNESHS